MQELRLNVIYHVKPGMVEEFMERLIEADVETIVRGEKGCEEYRYEAHAENNTIVLTERWTSKEMQQEHLKQPHMEIVKQLKDKYVLETEIS